jgi:hypothetical protein
MTTREIAQRFGTWIANTNYPAARELLTAGAQAVYTLESIAAAVASMTATTAGPIQRAQLVEEGIMEEWPEKQPGDVAIVYVALMGEGFAEAVLVTVVQQDGELRIRELEWGRP